MGKNYDELMRTVNGYIAILKAKRDNTVHKAVLSLLRECFQKYALDPDKTDDPAACRKYLGLEAGDGN